AYTRPRKEDSAPETTPGRARKALPSGATHMTATAANGKIYLVGGFLGSQHKDAVAGAFEYDPAVDTWRTLAPLSSPRGSVALAAVGGKVHALGGRGADLKTLTTHQGLDPATGPCSIAP